MFGATKEFLKKLLRSTGYSIVLNQPSSDFAIDMEPEFRVHYERCRSFTMTSVPRMYGLYTAVKYILRAGIAGDLVELGVWRGGSSMLAALTLLEQGDRDRRLWLYDTFAGMSEPTAGDISHDGKPAFAEWAASMGNNVNQWCYAGIDEVKANLASTGFPRGRVEFVEGKVENTIPGRIPERISLLRLDTDWYESTLHELEHLYPRLSPNGVLILDDYGHWQGARRAVDEYFSGTARPLLLNRLDYTGRMAVKPCVDGQGPGA